MAQQELHIEDVTFPSDHFRLAGRIYRPASTTATLPGIVMGLGTANLMAWFGHFAEAFARAGFSVLIFDYPYWGQSSGEPRQHIDPWVQIEAIRDAVGYLCAKPDVDAERIGVWGSSGGGGNALVAAAIDPRVKAAVAQIPMVYVHQTALQTTTAAQRNWVGQMMLQERAHRLAGGETLMIPLVDPNPEVPSFLNDADSHVWLEGLAVQTPNWRNEITLASVEKILNYTPEAYASRISVPTRMIIARDDDQCPADLSVKFFQDISSEKKDIVWIEGRHLAPFFDEHTRSVNAASEWFELHLSWPDVKDQF